MGFFTNAAESLLRSQEFVITNYDIYGNVNLTNPVSYLHFGLTNIPIYNSTNPSIRYSEKIHRLLQLAANIYDASRPNNYRISNSLPYPSVFRPIFFATNTATNRQIYIVGYTQVTNDAAFQMSKPFVDFTNSFIGTNNGNLWGIPWVVGAVKGLPAFDRYVSGTSWMVTRKLLFTRYPGTGTNSGIASKPPQYTNQFFIMSVSNFCGMDALNGYVSNINYPFQVVASNYVTVTMTNNSAQKPFGFSNSFSNTYTGGIASNFWPGFVNPTQTNGLLAFFQTNVFTLPQAYFSENKGKLLPVSGNLNVPGLNLGDAATTNGFLTNDLIQQYPWPVYGWTLSVTNRVMYALLDAGGQAFDFVNLGPFGITMNLTNLLVTGTPTPSVQPGGVGGAPSPSDWLPGPRVPGFHPCGMLNQISNCITSIHLPTTTFFGNFLEQTPPTQVCILAPLMTPPPLCSPAKQLYWWLMIRWFITRWAISRRPVELKSRIWCS